MCTSVPAFSYGLQNILCHKHSNTVIVYNLWLKISRCMLVDLFYTKLNINYNNSFLKTFTLHIGFVEEDNKKKLLTDKYIVNYNFYDLHYIVKCFVNRRIKYTWEQ